eukprot:1156508-Pelagomonas_calceolata.AAC.3
MNRRADRGLADSLFYIMDRRHCLTRDDMSRHAYSEGLCWRRYCPCTSNSSKSAAKCADPERKAVCVIILLTPCPLAWRLQVSVSVFKTIARGQAASRWRVSIRYSVRQIKGITTSEGRLQAGGQSDAFLDVFVAAEL